MFDQKVIIAEQFPVAQKARKHTDICCSMIGGVFAMFMLVTALIVYSPNKYEERFGLPQVVNDCQNGGYLHFPEIQYGSSTKTCLNACPQNYGSGADKICVPEDEAVQFYNYTVVPILTIKNREGFAQTLLYTIVITFGVGLVWIACVFVVPKHAPMIAVVSGIISLLLLLSFTILSTQEFWGQLTQLKLFPIAVSALLIIILLGMLFSYRGELKFQGIILKYSNTFLFQNCLTFIYIPIFLLLIYGLFALIWFQNMAFQSKFAVGHNSLNYRNSGVLSYLNLIELLWGLQFMRDAFYFCVSGNAVDWYWKGDSSTFASMMRLVCRNWGSVVGGSFLNAFFEIPTLFLQLFTCHPDTCCSKAGTFCTNSCNSISCFFNMIRTDAYSYLNLSGIPFCNSARNCEYLCSRSKQFVGNHSAMKHYRFVAFVFLVTILCFIAQWILNYRMLSICPCNLAIGVVIIYGTIALFIDIHASAAQALQTCYLAEFQLQQGYKYMKKILPVTCLLYLFQSIRSQLQFLDSQIKLDGKC